MINNQDFLFFSEILKLIETDFEIAFFNFMNWYNKSNSELKLYINNYKIINEKGNNMSFQNLINKYQRNPLNYCFKDFNKNLKLCIKSFLKSNKYLEIIYE